MHRILIIEDDFALNNTLAYNLRSVDFLADSAYNAIEALYYLKNFCYTLLILDVNLPDGNGYDLFHDFKQKSNASIFFLTANDMEEDMIKGFDLGAADYITKPFYPIVLQKKIIAFTKYIVEKKKESIYDDGILYLNFSRAEALLNGNPIELSPLEYRISKYFIQNKKHILKRDQLLEHLWEPSDNFVGDTALNAAVSRLRKKIEISGHNYIKTIYGTGYIWIGD